MAYAASESSLGRQLSIAIMSNCHADNSLASEVTAKKHICMHSVSMSYVKNGSIYVDIMESVDSL